MWLNDSYFFLHVMKTGGTTLWDTLRSAFGIEVSESWMHVWDCQKLGNTRFEGGHYFYQWVQQRYGYRKFLTLLRDPVDRIVSDYAHAQRWKRLPWQRDALHMGVVEWAKKHPFVGQNVYCRYLTLDGPYDAREPDLTLATSVLESFAWVGITEDYERSLRRLEDLLGVTLERGVRSNQTPNRVTISKLERLELQRMNSLDYRLYGYARGHLA